MPRSACDNTALPATVAATLLQSTRSCLAEALLAQDDRHELQTLPHTVLLKALGGAAVLEFLLAGSEKAKRRFAFAVGSLCEVSGTRVQTACQRTGKSLRMWRQGGRCTCRATSSLRFMLSLSPC